MACEAMSGNHTALPAAAFADKELQCRYSMQLEAMGERALNGGPSYEAYRFLWLRAFKRPVMVRIESREGVLVLEAKEADGMAAFAPGKVSEHVRRLLSKREWDGLRAVIAASGFWAMSSAERDVIQGDVEAVADGAVWLVEGARFQEHRVVALGTVHILPANSRRENEQLRDAALRMLQVAGVDLTQPGEIY